MSSRGRQAFRDRSELTLGFPAERGLNVTILTPAYVYSLWAGHTLLVRTFQGFQGDHVDEGNAPAADRRRHRRRPPPRFARGAERADRQRLAGQGPLTAPRQRTAGRRLRDNRGPLWHAGAHVRLAVR